FSDGAVNIAQVTLSTTGGTTTASFSASSLTAGSHTITVYYGGDDNFLASTGTLTQAVAKASLATLGFSYANPSQLGQSVTFTATVSGSGSPTGTVTFSDGGIIIGQGTLSGTGATPMASFNTSGLTAGTHAIIASYDGDSNFLASTGTLTQTVGKAS